MSKPSVCAGSGRTTNSALASQDLGTLTHPPPWGHAALEVVKLLTVRHGQLCQGESQTQGHSGERDKQKRPS